MGLVAKDDRKPLTPAPAGVHNAVCCDVVDLGLVDSPWGEKPQVEFRWQIGKTNPENGKPFMVVRRFTLSLSEKSNLRPFLEGWFGRALEDEEAKTGIDLEDVCLGLGCLLQVMHDTSAKGNVFAYAKAALPIPDGQETLPIREYVRVKDRGA